MANHWGIQDARSRLDEVIEKVINDGPQTITGGKAAVVVLTTIDYQKLRPRKHLVDVFLESPLRGEALDLESFDKPRD